MKGSMIAMSVLLLFGGACAAGETTVAATGVVAGTDKTEGVEATTANAERVVNPQSTEGTAAAAESTESSQLMTNEHKVNYSLGFDLGQDLKRQGLEVAPEVLLRGVSDAMSGAKPEITSRQRRAALKEIRQQRAQENLEQSLAFLQANAQKDGITTLSSGLQYKEIKAGEGRMPGPKDSVVVHYRGTLIDGTEFDNSRERGRPATFPVGKVIKGWSEALQLMKEGAQWELFIPPDLAYGKLGRKERIPANSALIFEVELISVK